MKKPAIPAISLSDQQVAAILRPMKENIESITGLRGAKLDALPSNASLSDVITKLNQVIARINA
jgi:hypothetical protein